MDYLQFSKKRKQEVGSIKNNNLDSVKEIREIRNKLSKEPIDLDEMNNFGKL